ncbi:39S ribosomal protein L46, mitochondrial isoform X1 [Neodiprion fabricii]|uniref:39S ribosomal protein L46, mitochondrial isoform X1 n=2 Tax=Neodiprion fabricii TaxID=2872261 RepID=UPI001ED91D0F|nr:39S ribosomal protein L46, mitochondrial isoform X1 [Neodiprion fabricii]
MFKRSLHLCAKSTINSLSTFMRLEARSTSTTSKTISEAKEKWDLVSAVCVERHPVISKPLKDIEAKFQHYLDQLEFENSMKSDHELRHKKDKEIQEQIKAGTGEIDMDAIKQTAQDFEDASLDELNKFQFASRTTEADKKNDLTSLDRKLDKNLVLLVEQQVGEKIFWIPPQGVRKDGETLRQTAERVLKETCGETLNVKFYGNAPCGFYKYKYPQTLRETGVIGAKIFYYQAKYLKGSLASQAKYQWLDREELENTLPVPLKKSVTQFLIDED